MLSNPREKPTCLGNPGAAAGSLATGDLPLPGVETPGKESESADFIGDLQIPVTSASFFGVAGASHISTSLEVSELSNEIISTDLCCFCWIEMSGGTSLAGTALLSELSLKDFLSSASSDLVNSWSPAFLDVPTLVACRVLSEKEVVGVSVSLDRSRGDSSVDRLVSGCSDTDVLAFLFPRSLLVSEGLRSEGSDGFCSPLPDLPLK